MEQRPYNNIYKSKNIVPAPNAQVKLLMQFFLRGAGIMENTNNSAMITCNDYGMTSCNEVLHTSICNDSKVTRLDKNDWWYLVNQLEQWGVFKPRAIVKKNPLAAWKCMNLCKDKNVRHKGSYFTVCFRRELAFAELKEKLGA